MLERFQNTPPPQLHIAFSFSLKERDKKNNTLNLYANKWQRGILKSSPNVSFFFFRKEHPYDVPEVISVKVTIMWDCF